MPLLPRSSFRPTRAFVRYAVLAGAMLLGIAPAAAVGRWLPGGTFDPARSTVVSFLRFLADDGDGQMTIRCDGRDGLSVDVGVTGNAELPAGVQTGAVVTATLSFVGATTTAIDVTGPIMVRQDGAVIITVAGDAVVPVAPLLLSGADHLDITIGKTTRSVPLAPIAETLTNFSSRCATWPG